jgi:hypothetical protein
MQHDDKPETCLVASLTNLVAKDTLGDERRWPTSAQL